MLDSTNSLQDFEKRIKQTQFKPDEILVDMSCRVPMREVESIEDMLDLMTDRKVSMRLEEGSHSKDSLYFIVMEKLNEFSKSIQASNRDSPRSLEKVNKSNDKG